MPNGALQVYGTQRLEQLGRELRAIGGPSARGIRSHMRKSIVAAAQPMRRDVQAAYKAIPVQGRSGSTGLRSDLARATQIRILASSRSAVVQVRVNPARMPAGKGGLVALMEGLRPWRHPVYGNNTWVSQAAHPTFYPTVRRREAAVRAATVAAIRSTINQIH